MRGLKQVVRALISRGVTGWRHGARHAWILGWAALLAVPLAISAGFDFDREVRASGTFWVDDAPGGNGMPVLASSHPRSSAWAELLRSYQVLEPVVASRGVRSPGSEGQGVANGASGGAREAARELEARLTTVTSPDGKLLRVELSGEDPTQTLELLRALMAQYVRVAAELKQARLEERGVVLREQLALMERELMEAEDRRDAFLSDPVAPQTLGSIAWATEERRLRRRIDSAENLYNEILTRTEMARLAELSSIPDVRILDMATLLDRSGPSRSVVWLLPILLGCLGVGTSVVLTQGHLDARHPSPAYEAAVRRFGGEQLPGIAILTGTLLAVAVTLLVAL